MMSQGRYAEAQPMLREALHIRKKKEREQGWQTAEAQRALGTCLTALGQYEEAESLLLESYPVLQAERGAQHRLTQQARKALADLYTTWGKLAQAAAYTSPTE